jgi:hypothetical protein
VHPGTDKKSAVKEIKTAQLSITTAELPPIVETVQHWYSITAEGMHNFISGSKNTNYTQVKRFDVANC